LPELIAVDPGGTTGWARFETPSQKPVEIGEVVKDKLYSWLELQTNHGTIWVVEDYIIRPPSRRQGGHDHFWNKGDTLRLIGAIQYHAHIHQQLFYLQQPSIKPLAYKQMGAEYVKGKPNMHIKDAVAHGVHFIGKSF
jgi:hypothetical protein